MTDPSQTFVTNAVTRRQIAENLSEATAKPVPEDSPLLTDEVCRSYASALGEIGDVDYDAVDELSARTADALGLARK